MTIFADAPDVTRTSGCSRWCFWLRLFALRHASVSADAAAPLYAGFSGDQGVPIANLYDHMRTAVTGEDGDVGSSITGRSWRSYNITASIRGPAGVPGQDQWQGQASVRLHAAGFCLARSFRNLDDLNSQLDERLTIVANVRLHGTTQKVVAEAFAVERSELQTLRAGSFDELLKLERRVSHDGLVSTDSNH